MFTQKQLKQFIKDEWSNREFKEVKNPLPDINERPLMDARYKLYDIRYYEDELNIIERVY